MFRFEKKYILFYFLFSILFGDVKFDEIVDLKVTKDRDNYRLGEFLKLTFEINVADNFCIYSTDSLKAPMGGETYIEYYDSLIFKNIGNLEEPIPITKFDKNFNQETSSHEGSFSFIQTLIINDDYNLGNDSIYIFEASLFATACDPSQCVRVIEDFEISLNLENKEPRDEYKKLISSLSTHTDKGLFSFVLFAFGMGFLALLTPCVFPMIPITVSYFTKEGEKENSKPIKSATIYALGIIVIFTLLGLVLAFTLGAEGAGFIASDPWVNLFIASLFIFFAFSLFGYYELEAPSFLRQYSLQQESRGGIVGILFMSLTFTLTSFTCTVQFVGLLLVAASHGEYFWPIIGMLSFSAAFAFPFFFLALFPQYLSKLPKSGGWLNSVKVTMGFLELAAAFKFLSNSDLVWKWNIFTREVVLFIWVLILLLMAVYFIGMLRFPHDSKLNIISNKRKIAFSIFLLFSIYFSTGLINKKIYSGNSNTLYIISGLIESYLPPPVLDNKWIEDLDVAYEKSKEFNMPIFLDFTGYTCTNCRYMEINIFEDPDVKKLFDNFVLAKLYTDGKEKKHREYRDLEIDRFGTAALPFYVVLNPDDKVIKTFPGYDPNVDNFINFLRSSLDKFNNEKK